MLNLLNLTGENMDWTRGRCVVGSGLMVRRGSMVHGGMGMGMCAVVGGGGGRQQDGGDGEETLKCGKGFKKIILGDCG